MDGSTYEVQSIHMDGWGMGAMGGGKGENDIKKGKRMKG